MGVDKLPKVNKRKEESREAQRQLHLTIINAIEKMEYKFQPFEIDNVLLEIVKNRHEMYLTSKFGADRIY